MESVNDLIRSTKLKNLKIIKLGFCNLEKILKELQKSHNEIYIPLTENSKKYLFYYFFIKIKREDDQTLRLDMNYKYIKNGSFSILVK